MIARRLILLIVLLAALACSAPAFAGDPLTNIKINEVEMNGTDFIELTNTSDTATDAGGLVLKDNDDTHTQTLPSPSLIQPHQFLAVNTTFGLGSADSARLFSGATLLDSYSWVVDPATSYGRCPDATGVFRGTLSITKGAANDCPTLTTAAWPGGAAVATADQAGELGTDVSGLEYEGTGSATPGVLWAVDNGDSLVQRLVFSGGKWIRDTTNGWAAGKGLRYTNGSGLPDAEGVTLTDAGSAGGVFVSSERDGSNNTVSRPSVLRYDVSGAAPLTAQREWNLTADLPAVGANTGIEALTWVPDTYLVGSGFQDPTTGLAYDPAHYPNHGTGLFFVGLEANGMIYAYALDQTSNSFSRVASFASGFPTIAELHWEQQAKRLWAICDNNCDGRTGTFTVQQGTFKSTAYYERPTGMTDNYNNEGFTLATATDCVGGVKPAFWSDDGATTGNVIRQGTVNCVDVANPTPTPTASATVTATATATTTPTATSTGTGVPTATATAGIVVNPTITGKATSKRAPSKAGWYRTPVTVTFACAAGSAPVTCPDAVVLSKSGAKQSVTRTATALDGGTATATVGAINIDRDKPTVKLRHAKGAKPKCKATDKLSGVASCKVKSKTKKGKRTVTATATDRAGNVATARVRFRV